MSKNQWDYLRSVLSVLRRPQRKHFITYLIGLIWMIKFRSIREIATHFGQGRVDNLHHFMRNSQEATAKIQQAHDDSLTSQIDHRQQTLVMIDDTSTAREGKHIEGLGIHHGAKGLVKGLCAVTVILKQAGRCLCWALEGYYPKLSCPQGTPFRSKVQIACAIIDQLRGYLQGPVIVLMDSWYCCQAVLKRIIKANWIFLAAIKCNRIILVDGLKTNVCHLAKGPRAYTTVRLSKKRRFKIAQRIILLPHIGTVILFICKHHGQTRFFITNDLSMTETQMATLYAQRFEIEVFHKDIKQHLGFEELFVRSKDCVQKHWTILMIAYNLTALGTHSRNKSFRHKIRRFRRGVNIDSLHRFSNRLNLLH